MTRIFAVTGRDDHGRSVAARPKLSEPMSRIGLALLVALVAGSFTASPTRADDVGGEPVVIPPSGEYHDEDEPVEVEHNWAQKGPYIMGSAQYAVQNFQNKGQIDDNHAWNDVPGASLRVGYRIVPRLSLEAQAEWERFDEDGSSAEFDAWTVSANWRAYFTETRIQPYMLFGLGALIARGDVDGNDIMLRVGFGLDWNITENIGLVTEAQYVPALNNLSEIDFFSFGVGIQYKFGPIDFDKIKKPW